MKNVPLLILFYFGLAMILISCQIENKTNAISQDLSLLDRSEKTQLGKEWDQVQNHYMKNMMNLDQNIKPIESRLNLVKVFISEARVTGEHGHYYPAALSLLSEIQTQKKISQDQRFQTLALQSSVLLSLHQFDKALEVAQEAILINPHNAQIYGALVDCYVEMGDYTNAIKAADKMISIKPDIRSYSRISYLREIYGDIPGAIEALKLAIKSGYPGTEETAWAMQTLAELYIQYDMVEKADKVFKEILTIRPNYPFAVAGLGDIATYKNNKKGAIRLFDQAIKIIPEVGFYISKANTLKSLGQIEESKEIVQEVLFMLADDEAAGHLMNLEYGDVYLHLLDEPKKALDYVNIEYQKRPDNIDVNLALSEIYYELEDFSKVKEHLQKAAVTNSKSPKLQYLTTQSEQFYSSL